MERNISKESYNNFQSETSSSTNTLPIKFINFFKKKSNDLNKLSSKTINTSINLQGNLIETDNINKFPIYVEVINGETINTIQNHETIIEHELDHEALQLSKITIWCNDCQKQYVEVCQKHEIIHINDKEVLPKSRASLPSCLGIEYFNENLNGIISRKILEKRTCFGPYIANRSLEFSTLTNISLFVIITMGGKFEYLDTSNDNECNWMKHVRLCNAPAERNVLAYQHDENIFFITTKTINVDEELRVWFAPPYLERLINFSKINKNALLYDEFQKLMRRYTVSSVLQVESNNKTKMIEGKSNLYWKKRKILLESLNREKENIGNDEEIATPVSKNHSVNNSIDDLFCKKCSIHYDTVLKYMEHMNEHDAKYFMDGACSTKLRLKRSSSDIKLACNRCSKKFVNIEKLRKHYLCHMIEHNKPFNCMSCDRRFISKTALISHMRMHKLAKNYTCKLCSMEFGHLSNLRIHSNEHFSAETNHYKCTKCIKEFKSLKLASIHHQLTHSPKSFGCTICSLAFTTQCLLSKHSLSHSLTSVFMCEICSRQFKRADKLKDHFRRLHLSGKYDLQFLKTKLKKKVVIEDREGSYICEMCQKTFIRRGMLVNHIHRSHPNVTISQISQLNKPITVTVREFFCQYCKKVYKSNNKRKEHILKKHPGSELPSRLRPIYCRDSRPMYTAETGQVQKLAQACSHCHRQYSTKAKLLQHIRLRHKDNASKQIPKFAKENKTSRQLPTKLNSNKSTSSVHTNITLIS